MTTKDLERGPWSYDLYSDGLQPVALLNNSDHSQGEWVSIEDYRKLEHKLDLVMQTESKAETAIGDAQLAHFQSQP